MTYGQDLAKRICLLSDARMHETVNGFEYLSKIDAEGMLVGEPLKYEPCDKEFHYWTCNNCGFRCESSETFDEMRAHLGKRNVMIHPFAESMDSTPPEQMDLIPDPFKNTAQHQSGA